MREKPKSFRELANIFRGKKSKDKEQIQESVGKLKETIPEVGEAIGETISTYAETVAAVPGVAKETIQRGLENEKGRIDKDFGIVDDRAIQSELEAGIVSGATAKKQENFLGKNKHRSSVLRKMAEKTSKAERKVGDLGAKSAIKGTKAVAKGLAVFRMSKTAEKVQEWGGKTAQEMAGSTRFTDKANRVVTEVGSAHDRAQGAMQRGKFNQASFEGKVDKAEQEQARVADEKNERSEAGANFVKGVGKAGLVVRSFFGKTEMGMQAGVGAAVVSVFKGKKGDLKQNQKATLNRHEKGLESPNEVKIAQGIMDGIYYVQDRAGDVKQWTKAKAKAANKWKNDRVEDVKGGIDTMVTGAYTVATDTISDVKGGIDTMVTGAYTVATDTISDAGKAIKGAGETVALGAMYAGDAIATGALTVAGVGVGAVAMTAAVGELALDGAVKGAKFVGGKAKDAKDAVDKGMESAGKFVKATAEATRDTVQAESAKAGQKGLGFLGGLAKGASGFFNSIGEKFATVDEKCKKGIDSLDPIAAKRSQLAPTKEQNESSKNSPSKDDGPEM